MGVHVDTISAAINRLRKSGCLLVIRRRKRGKKHDSNFMRLNLECVLERPYRALNTGAEDSTPSAQSGQTTGYDPVKRPGTSRSNDRALSGQTTGLNLTIEPSELNLPIEPSNTQRQRCALAGRIPSDESMLQECLTVWNEMRDRIQRHPLHFLRNSHREALRAFVAIYGMAGWRAVVHEVEINPFRNGQHAEATGATRLGRALRDAQWLIEGAMHEGRFADLNAPTMDW
jgi:hypothetical protein